MIQFKKENNFLILEYSSDIDMQFLKDKFNDNAAYKLNNIFELRKDNVYGDFDTQIKNYEIKFKLANLEENYYSFVILH